MMVEDVWKNFDNYFLQKKVLEQAPSTFVSKKESNQTLTMSKLRGDTGALNRDFLEPGTGTENRDSDNPSH